MRKSLIFALFALLGINTSVYCIDAWIRINQLGYLPYGPKKAVFLSETPQKITRFGIYDVLTNEKLAELKTVTSRGEFLNFKSTYILDFSSFQLQGAFYIKADLVYSPNIYINKNIYLGSADFLLNYLRNQRLTTDSVTIKFYEVPSRIEPAPSIAFPRKANKVSAPILASVTSLPELSFAGGWKDAALNMQVGAISADIVFQLLFAYQMNPTAFEDMRGADGSKTKNGIPDVLDEAKWGLDWLLKMYPSPEKLYHQIGNSVSAGNEVPVYLATGKSQGEGSFYNHSNGMASVAGKYASVFALGADLLTKYYPVFADTLSVKALSAYEFGKKNPGVCQAVPTSSTSYMEEDNWTDDMELAATQLFQHTYTRNYLFDAASFGRMEPVTPWMCSDTARNYQWFPFLNMGHFMLANVENPRYQKEFLQNMQGGIQRVSLRASENPFNVGVPFISGSNMLVTAMATQCRLYRSISGDSTYQTMENSLVDWLFGCNPWGTSMIIGFPQFGKTPWNPYSKSSLNDKNALTGALVNGPVQKSDYIKVFDSTLGKEDSYQRFQSEWAVYHDDAADDLTNKPTTNGTAALSYLLASKQKEGVSEKTTDKNEYAAGGLIRTDATKKQICLVFSGHDLTDGYKVISKTLKKQKVTASFFFTGDFYRKAKNTSIIKKLKKQQFYLGPHSDKNILFNSITRRDSMAIGKSAFVNDLKANYEAMRKFEISKQDAPFFLPPHEWYNETISLWSKEFGLNLINFTPGTLSNTDISVPEMRNKYYSGIEIYNRIMEVEAKQTLNGYILLFHMGSEKVRQDKFYTRLNSLIADLKSKGYEFVDLYKATDLVDRNTTDNKSKK